MNLDGPCDWEPDYTAVSCSSLSSLPASGSAVFERMAVDYLWNWTGRVFGTCEVTVRPCRRDCDRSTYLGRSGKPGSFGTPWEPVLVNGNWYNIGCGTCGSDCSCDSVSMLELPGPVDSVTQVVVDGAVVDPSNYRVDNRRWLVRTDGGQWPICQDLGADSAVGGAEGTWEVTYKRGTPVPVGGKVAAAALACELYKAAVKDNTCALPKRFQQVTRQGVTIIDMFEDLDHGRTGVWLVDSWVVSVTKSPRRSRVYSPDLRKTRRTNPRGQ